MNTFKNVVEKLKTLESERRNLLLEIEELKKMADSKAKALENEVSMLREEVKSLRVLLGAGDPELEPEPRKRQFQK
jgi:regulator of replication initiation timing